MRIYCFRINLRLTSVIVFGEMVLVRKFGSRWRVQKVAAHQSRAEVDSGRL